MEFTNKSSCNRVGVPIPLLGLWQFLQQPLDLKAPVQDQRGVAHPEDGLQPNGFERRLVTFNVFLFCRPGNVIGCDDADPLVSQPPLMAWIAGTPGANAFSSGEIGITELGMEIKKSSTNDHSGYIKNRGTIHLDRFGDICNLPVLNIY